MTALSTAIQPELDFAQPFDPRRELVRISSNSTSMWLTVTLAAVTCVACSSSRSPSLDDEGHR